MQVKKFINYTLLLFLLIFVFDLVIGFCSKHIENKATIHSPYGMATNYTLNKVNSDVIIIGSSRAEHHYNTKILKDSLHTSIYNCGLNGEFFLYQTAMINGILKRYSPKLILWDFEPIMYFQYTKESKQEELDRLSHLFSFYNSDEYIHNLLKQRSKYESIKLLSNTYRYNSRVLPLLYKCFMPDYKYYNGYAPLNTRGYTYPKLSKIDLNHEQISQERFILFKQILTQCKKKKVKIIICFSPRYTIDTYKESDSYKSIYNLTKEMNIPLLDFYHSQKIMKDSTNFKDPSHLNSKGANIYTRLITKKIKL